MSVASHAFTTARLTLRPAMPDDLAALLAMRSADAAADPTREARIRALLDGNAGLFALVGFGLWLIERDARAAGFVGLRPRESASEPELYYGLAPECRGHGLATEAAAAVIARLFRVASASGVWAVTDPENFASARVLARLGMRLELDGEFDGRPSRLYRLKRPR